MQFFLYLVLGVIASKESKRSRLFQVNKEALREVWYTATLRGLIKAKARVCFPLIPKVERILYKHCENEAKKTADLARCASKVFDARDLEKQFRGGYFRFKRYKSTYKLEQAKNHSLPSLKSKTKLKLKSDLRMDIIKTENETQVEMILQVSQEDTDDKRDDIKIRRRKEELLAKIANMYENALNNKKRGRWKRQVRDGQGEPLMDLTRKPLDYSKIAAHYFSSLFGKPKRSNRHIDNIGRIKEYFEKARKVEKYYSLVNRENSNKDPQVPNKEGDVLGHVLGIVNDFAERHLKSESKLSILSPRLFSILPDRSQKPKLLSPTMLSFHSDGFFSLPNLFQVVTSNQEYQKTMLELIMELSGAGEALEGAIAHIKPEMEELERVHYPLMLEMSKYDHQWVKARKTFSPDQENSYKRNGYAFLNTLQTEKVYSDRKFYFGGPVNVTEISRKSIDQRERDLESYIRDLAQGYKSEGLNASDRFKRQSEQDQEFERGVVVGEGNVITLAPVAFTSFINEGVIITAITLSPQFFILELLVSEFVVAKTLSPQAMVATILSPSALVARILSPSALEAEILSPRAFYAFVLSPRALITEILTPRAFEPRVLSPHTLIIDVLSPAFLSPNIGSGESFGLIILSPNFLSPRIESDEHFMLEVLSPHILGGPMPHGREDGTVIEIGGEKEFEKLDEENSDAHVESASTEGGNVFDWFKQATFSKADSALFKKLFGS